MLNQSEAIQKVIEFQQKKSKELNRSVTISEAIALWLYQTINLATPSGFKKKNRKSVSEELNIY